MPNEEDDNYRYYAKDHRGSVVMMTDRDPDTGGLSAEFYTYDSWGEHADTGAVPSTGNSIRYAGGRVEFFADGTAEGAVYLCGERHYMPLYGRFLQRDRLTYEKLPSPTNPLSANPYIYAENNPVMKKDINGLQPAGYYRGATMGGKSVIIGTQMPPEAQIYDCCGGGYHSLDATEVSFSLIHSTRLPGSGQAGYIDFTRLSKNAGWGGSLCDANPNEGQPNERCPETTTATSDLLCTYVEKCMGGSCPDWQHPGCPTGMGDAVLYIGNDGSTWWQNELDWWESTIETVPWFGPSMIGAGSMVVGGLAGIGAVVGAAAAGSATAIGILEASPLANMTGLAGLICGPEGAPQSIAGFRLLGHAPQRFFQRWFANGLTEADAATFLNRPPLFDPETGNLIYTAAEYGDFAIVVGEKGGEVGIITFLENISTRWIPYIW